MYQYLSFNDPEFKTKLINEVKTNGLAVINDVFTDVECDNHMTGILNDFVSLGTNIDLNNVDITWTTNNLPAQTRPGLFQMLMSNLKDVWNIRANDNVKTIFETLYSHFRKDQIKDFIVSGDGINIKPGTVGPFKKEHTKDWAHLDQTIKGDIYKCIQGQAVLTNTTASFVASPKSHLVFEDILNKLNVNSTANWLKFNDDQIKIVKELILAKGGQYQIPILSKKGSFIVWTSTTVHSAKLQSASESSTNEDKYKGWRGVIYVCYRPKSEFTKRELTKRQKVFDENRTTNHWSQTTFSKKPGSFHLYHDKRHNEIESMIKDPKLVYTKLGKPVLSDKQKCLLGL